MTKHFVAALLLLITSEVGCAFAQSTFDRKAAEAALDHMYKDLRRYYYDSTFHGHDFQAHTQRTRASFKDLKSEAAMLTALADYLKPLRDSHTYFIPPKWADEFSYGFDLQFFGDQALITEVQPGSDAEKKGLAKGDQVNTVDGYAIQRATFNELMYHYHLLAPRKSVQLAVTTPDGRMRQITLQTAVRRGMSESQKYSWMGYTRQLAQIDSLKKEFSHRYATIEKKAFVWKLPGFYEDDKNIRKLLDKAEGFETLILDFRGNPGGSVKTLRELVSGVFSTEIDIATLRSRDTTEILTSKPRKNAFRGRVIVLVDSESASAAEIFARLMQIYQRGTVIGDRTAGAVRASMHEAYTVRGVYDIGASITRSDVIMPDGGLLEGEGVTPNATVIMKNYNIVEGTDPVLAYALAEAGVEVNPAAAAQLLSNR